MNVITIIIILLLLFLSIIFFIRGKIVGFLSSALHGGFFVCVLLTLSALFLLWPYQILADWSLRAVGVLEGLQRIDETFVLDDVAESTQNFWEDVESFFTGKQQEDASAEEDSKGFFEDNLYELLVTAIGTLYRGIIILASIAGLVVILYMSYATAGLSELRQLREQYARLQERVNQLEGRFPAPSL